MNSYPLRLALGRGIGTIAPAMASEPVGARNSVVGAGLGVARGSPGGDDRRMTMRLLYLMFCQMVRWLALLSRSAAARTPNCSCCAMRSRCCGGGWSGRGSTGPTGRSWLGSHGCSRATSGVGYWCSRPRCCAGIGVWSGAAGPTTPAWPSDRDGPAPPVGPADGQGEPDLGLPPHPRRALPPRLQDRGQHRVVHPAAGWC